MQCARNSIHASARKKSKAYHKEHREKAEVTEKCVEGRENMTKLDLIFFAEKEEFCVWQCKGAKKLAIAS